MPPPINIRRATHKTPSPNATEYTRKMDAVRDNPGRVYAVHDVRIIARVWRQRGDDRRPGSNAMSRGLVGMVYVRYPRDGAGRLRVLVCDYGPDGKGYDILKGCAWEAGSASGYGYDKLAAALVGCRVGGIELGDHCDPLGRPTLHELDSHATHLAVSY